MGIKDNFSQAVKELWKKDGQGEAPANNTAGGTMLDQYLKQDGTEDRAPVQTSEPGRVPLETPYYPSSDQTAAARQTAEQTAPNTQNQPQNPSQQNVQTDQNNNQYDRNGEYGQGDRYNQNARYNNQNSQYNNQGGQYNRGAAPDNRGFQDYGGSEGASVPYYPNSTPAGYGGEQQQGGYRQENPGNYNVNRSLNGGSGNGGAMPPSSGGMMAAQNNGETDEITKISKNTIINGDVQSFDNLQIDGNIKGNVETTKNIDLSGKVVGDMVCNNAGMTSAAMQGNISLKGRVKMDRDTILIGDLSSQYADINGRVRGKLDIVGKAELKRDAIVFGDINASTIAVTDGAIIQGYVNTTFLSKEDSRNVFPEAISLESKDNSSNNR